MRRSGFNKADVDENNAMSRQLFADGAQSDSTTLKLVQMWRLPVNGPNAVKH